MDYGFTILMLIFSAAIQGYAAILAITKNYDLLPRRAAIATNPKDKKKYTLQLAKVLALVGLVPALCGIVGIWSPAGAGITGVIGLVVTFWLGSKFMKDVM